MHVRLVLCCCLGFCGFRALPISGKFWTLVYQKQLKQFEASFMNTSSRNDKNVHSWLNKKTANTKKKKLRQKRH